MVDLYNRERKFDKKKAELLNAPDSPSKEILLKYLKFHESKLERNQLECSSVLRSLEIAQNVCKCENLFSERPYSVEAVKLWWKSQIERKNKRNGAVVSIGTLNKFQGQAGKFLKFLEFIDTGEDIAFFNTQKLPPAKASKYFIVNYPKKQKEIPRLDLDKLILVLNKLMTSPLYYDRLAGVLLISAYDLGCRFGELASLKNKSMTYCEGQLLITLEDSKTKTRTIVPILSKKYLVNWQNTSPTKNDLEGYFFCDRKGGPIPYDKVSKALRKVSNEVGFYFPSGKLWHYLRHEFATRAYQMPEHLIRYYLGWSDSGIRAVYSHHNWKECLSYLQKMNENHPLLDEPLSILEKEEKSLFDKQLEQMVEGKVRAYLEKF